MEDRKQVSRARGGDHVTDPHALPVEISEALALEMPYRAAIAANDNLPISERISRTSRSDNLAFGWFSPSSMVP